MDENFQSFLENKDLTKSEREAYEQDIAKYLETRKKRILSQAAADKRLVIRNQAHLTLKEQEK